jgi:repressor LexA
MVNKKFTKLSERQRNILRFMQKYVNQTGYPPTIREIGEATGINSTSVVNYNLNKLVEAGYLERSDRVSRGLRLVADIPGVKGGKRVTSDNAFARVRLSGLIAAGEPMLVPEDTDHYTNEDDLIDVPPYLLNGNDPEDVFALRVRGDSMIDAMVQDNDLVILKKQSTANRGDMIAAWLPNDSETTLKYYFPEGEKIRLQPAHPTMQPIMVDASNCEIKGKVLSVIRQVQ